MLRVIGAAAVVVHRVTSSRDLRPTSASLRDRNCLRKTSQLSYSYHDLCLSKIYFFSLSSADGTKYGKTRKKDEDKRKQEQDCKQSENKNKTKHKNIRKNKKL